MSSDDADDERESPALTPVADWVDPRSLKFTLFVILPNEEVCTLRDLNSGLSVFDIKGHLELHAGIPCQVYTLVYPDGEELSDDQKLVVKENILHGYVLKMRLQETWESLYQAVVRNNIEQVYHSGGVHLKGNIVISADESKRYECVLKERGGVALYMASYLGLQRMVKMLLSVGVGAESLTYFGRSPLHAAAANDQVAVAQILLNHGAKISHRDCFGATPIAVASEMNSCLCLRHLRLIQLNLHGVLKYSKPSDSKLVNKKRLSLRSSDKSKHQRTHSTLSQYSESNSILKNRLQSQTLRKTLSSSAPVTELRIKPQVSNGTHSTVSTATTGKIRQRQNVKWHDSSAEYFQVTAIPRNIDKSVNVKQVTYSLPKTIFKFSAVNNQNLLDETNNGKITEGMTNGATTAWNRSEENLTPELKQAMRYSKQKLRHFKNLAKPVDDYIPMAERKKRSYQREPPEMSPAFQQWLAKKEDIEEAANESSSESGEYFNQSDPEEDRMVEFNKRVRKMNKKHVKRGYSKTPYNQPVLDILTFGSTVEGNANNPPPDGNIKAYKEWKTKRGEETTWTAAKSSKDLMVQKRKLEEKRQKLLMNAISYDEWLDHTEERKFLIRQILKADFDEMKKLEEQRQKDRQKLYSYEIWKEKLDKRELEQKKRKNIQKKYDQERLREKLELDRTSFAVPFDEWLQKKQTNSSRV